MPHSYHTALPKKTNRPFEVRVWAPIQTPSSGWQKGPLKVNDGQTKNNYSHSHFMPWLQRWYFVLFLTISVYASVESLKHCTMNESPSLINHTLVLFPSLNKVFFFYFRIDFLNSSGSSFQPRQKSSIIL